MSNIDFNSDQNALDNNVSTTVPFPPSVTVEEIVNKRKGIKISAKPSNGFIIYRGEYLKEMKRQNMKIGMRQLSKRVGAAWRKEPLHIKKWYKNLAEEVADFIAKLHIQSPNFVSDPWKEEYSANQSQKADVIDIIVPSQNEQTFDRSYEANKEINIQNIDAQNEFPEFPNELTIVTHSYAPFSKQNEHPILLNYQTIDSYPEFFYFDVSATTTPLTEGLNYIDQSQQQSSFNLQNAINFPLGTADLQQENINFLHLCDQTPQNFDPNFDPLLYPSPEVNTQFYNLFTIISENPSEESNV
ncbi:5873_t:CDS:1 [Ambispora gerdemannii]|uniref:5873_t:CDS:1 n=1 Tax=Ambispora gerdemannii TaxID=144530 RepID=A0A9N8W4Z0_9GLOM|nr:5873_t:CDS:1 [Ambispora gerdemannii]